MEAVWLVIFVYGVVVSATLGAAVWSEREAMMIAAAIQASAWGLQVTLFVSDLNPMPREFAHMLLSSCVFLLFYYLWRHGSTLNRFCLILAVLYGAMAVIDIFQFAAIYAPPSVFKVNYYWSQFLMNRIFDAAMALNLFAALLHGAAKNDPTKWARITDVKINQIHQIVERTRRIFRRRK